jgi:hypothetical protein
MTVNLMVMNYSPLYTQSCRGTHMEIILGEITKLVIRQLLLNTFSAKDEISHLEIQFEFTFNFLFNSVSEAF